MPDAAALSAGPSSLAALLTGVSADSGTPTAANMQGTDPFAALLADAGGAKKDAAAPAKGSAANTIAALLASAAPAPVTTTTVDTEATLPAPTGKSGDADDDSDSKIDSKDPLADAIASGATAVLAIAPAIVAPAQPPVPNQAPIRIDTATAPRQLKPMVVDQTRSAVPPAIADATPDPDAAVPTTTEKGGSASDDAVGKGGPAIVTIANATAALALTPAVMTPVQPETPVSNAPVATTPIKLASIVNAPVAARFRTAASANPPTQGGQANIQDQLGSDTAEADADTPRQQAPAPDIVSAPVQLTPEVAKAVMAALKQGDTAPATSVTPAPADPTAAIAVTPNPIDPTSAMAVESTPAQAVPAAPADPTASAAVTAKTQNEQQSQQLADHEPRQQVAAAQVQPAARRRSDETPATRRAGDARKRVDHTATDAASTGQTQQTTEAAQAKPAQAGAGVHAKGDTIVQQTLTIARDGAWLDRLAKDIAGAGSGKNLHFTLNPENLGALSVAISQKDDGASIRLTADNETTRKILVDAQPKLVDEARAQGLKVSETQVDVRQDQNKGQNQSANQDAQRWAQNQAGQNSQQGQNGQNRQSSPDHKPFVSNLARKAEEDSESPDRDSGSLYA